MLNLQPDFLKSDLISLVPLTEVDFESVYLAASDPLIWEQHPEKNRYKKEVFQTYFNSAIESNGAFKICNADSNNVIGCSRYYNLDEGTKTVMVGYTFLSRPYWGGLYNLHLKKLMFNHAFAYGYKVHLQIGANNIRSQKATEKLGARKIDETRIDFPNENPSLHYVYEIGPAEFISAP